ncbi:fructose-6-phosphate aldolase [Roseobacter sp. CCS2]|nr:fructose-6-phosphate aldolase [Roseobacter sp. CCS2]
MAHQTLQKTVFYHPRIAMVAADLMTAGPA